MPTDAKADSARKMTAFWSLIRRSAVEELTADEVEKMSALGQELDQNTVQLVADAARAPELQALINQTRELEGVYHASLIRTGRGDLDGPNTPEARVDLQRAYDAQGQLRELLARAPMTYFGEVPIDPDISDAKEIAELELLYKQLPALKQAEEKAMQAVEDVEFDALVAIARPTAQLTARIQFIGSGEATRLSTLIDSVEGQMRPRRDAAGAALSAARSRRMKAEGAPKRLAELRGER